jgi:hypothetical protein
MLSKDQVVQAIIDGIKSNHDGYLDCGIKLGLPAKYLRVETNPMHDDCVHIAFNSCFIYNEDEDMVKQLVDKYWDSVQLVYKQKQELIKNTKYYGERWDLYYNLSGCYILDSWSLKIVEIITGVELSNLFCKLESNVALIESIDESIWRLGEYFARLSGWSESMIECICRVGDQVRIILKANVLKETIESNIVYKKLFTNSTRYVINYSEVENFIEVLELMYPVGVKHVTR